MRILMTTDSVGGVWQYSLVLARTLTEDWDCRIRLVCFGRWPDRDLKDGFTTDQVELLALPHKLEWMPDSTVEVSMAIEEVSQLAVSWGADILHSNQFCFGQIKGSIPRVVVAHSDVLSWTLCHRGAPATMDAQLLGYRQLVTSGLSEASAVVCPSRFMARQMESIYGSSSRVIYNGLPPELYRSTSKQPQAAIAGRLWDESKMAAVAVRAVEGLPVRLALAGPTVGPSGETAPLPSLPNTRYLGNLSWEDTRQLLAQSRFYLATSSYEPFGLAALEAALSGCALLAADTPFYREVWGDAAVYYRVRDSDDLRRKLEGLIQDEAGTEAMATAARERALSRYTAGRMAEEYYQLYRSLLCR